MYLYLYDSFLNNKKYSHLLAKIETRLTDLGIGGKIFRLSPLRNIAELLNDEVRNGAKTVIVVGNDKTFSDIINVAAKLDVTLGIVPVGPDNKIADMLGISSYEQACNVIAARKIEKMDLGKVNTTYFLSKITVGGGEVTIECENKYKVTPAIENEITICNLKPIFAQNNINSGYFNPQDGLLELFVQPIKKAGFWFSRRQNDQNSIIPFKEVSITSKASLPIVTDGQKILKTPVKIKIVPKKLRVIVGKNRVF